MKSVERWYSPRLQQHLTLARWGSYGVPVLVFPTAGGDAEEIERNNLVGACRPLIEAGRVKLYSVDSVAGAVMLAKEVAVEHRMWLLNQYHEAIAHEVAPAMRLDSGGYGEGLIAAGASIGAFNAVTVLCRYPDVFGAAIGMSGSYDVQRFYDGAFTEDLYFSSPLHFLPGLEGDQLAQLRRRFTILAAGDGAHESIGESWRVADVLGAKGVPNRVDAWGPDWPHEWHTWHAMLPQYLDELVEG
jgi:esterase/lipase superfamily enzyme